MWMPLSLRPPGGLWGRKGGEPSESLSYDPGAWAVSHVILNILNVWGSFEEKG